MSQSNDILTYLQNYCYGSSQAVTAERLAEISFTTAREVNAVIRELREAGEHIGSGSNGYFMIETPDEYDALIRQLDSRFEDLCALRKTVKRNKENFPAPQEAMF